MSPGPWQVGRSVLVLVATTAGDCLDRARFWWGRSNPRLAYSSALSDGFVGVFVVAVLGQRGGARSRRLTAALKNRMDLSLSIAIGSSVQVALLVTPVLVLAEPRPRSEANGSGLSRQDLVLMRASGSMP